MSGFTKDELTSAIAFGLAEYFYLDFVAATWGTMLDGYMPAMFTSADHEGFAPESVALYKRVMDLRLVLLEATGLKESWTEDYKRITKETV